MSEEKAILLIVDDMKVNVAYLSRVLGDDYEIMKAYDGREALEGAANKTPDLILMDVMMPEMDGLEVCAKLKSDPNTQNIPIIFITAKGEVEDEEKGLSIGAVDYIRKPISMPIVKARVKNHLQMKRQRDLLEELSLVDGLTGIANRRRFDDVLDREWRRAARLNHSVALIMVDIDHFKGYNDFYGHAGGDICLEAVAKALAGALNRPVDLAARYGGEEFAAVLPDTDLGGGGHIAEKMRDGIALLNIEHAESPTADHVTASFGVAAMKPEPESDKSDLVKAADKALYRAKQNGRNRVILVG